MWGIVFGFLTAIFPALGKWLPNPDRELGRAETNNADLVAENKKLREQLKTANQGTTVNQVETDLQGGKF